MSTGLLSAMMLMSAVYYFVNTEEVSKEFINLGYNSRIIIPLAILKILGVATIWLSYFKPLSALKEWAYFGFFCEFMLAAESHVSANDGDYVGALLALGLLIVSYIFSKDTN